MADYCGATGTTLDRTVQSFMNRGNAPPKAAAAARAVLSHAVQQQPSTASSMSMPMAAPRELALLSQQQPRPTPPPQQQHYSSQSQQQQQQQQPFHQQQYHHHPGGVHQQQYHQMMMIQQQQQQQSMMMMQQQQQQLAQMVLRQQQAMSQKKQEETKSAAASPSLEQQTKKNWEHDHLGLDEAQLKAEMQEHLNQLAQENNPMYSEGLVQGASMEELAAAWARAEAEYQEELFQSVEDATNLAAAVDVNDTAAASTTTGVLKPYEFINRVHGPEQQQQQSLNWMEEGMREFRLGNLKEAIRAFEMELQLGNANSAKAWRMLGKCHAENDQDREAITCLEHAVDRDPYSQEALLDLGVSYVNELNHEKALEALLAWIHNNPKYAGMEITDDLYGSSTNSATHTTTRSLAAFDEVQRLLLRALEFGNDTSTTADAWQALGVVYNVSRDYDAAIDSFQKALELEPNNYPLWNKLGATYANSHRSELALPAYHRALSQKPKYARAWLNMAIAHSNLNNYEEAARCYLQTLSLNPSALHCWSYLRIALSCAERFDLIPAAASQDLVALSEHFDFVLYNHHGINDNYSATSMS